jgi:hypothetical protein
MIKLIFSEKKQILPHFTGLIFSKPFYTMVRVFFFFFLFPKLYYGLVDTSKNFSSYFWILCLPTEERGENRGKREKALHKIEARG